MLSVYFSPVIISSKLKVVDVEKNKKIRLLLLSKYPLFGEMYEN